MIPLSVFLIAWIILLAIYAIISLISIIQMVRFGIASSMTYFSTAVFLIVALIGIGGTCFYLATVDWSIGLDIASIFRPPTISL